MVSIHHKIQWTSRQRPCQLQCKAKDKTASTSWSIFSVRETLDGQQRAKSPGLRKNRTKWLCSVGGGSQQCRKTVKVILTIPYKVLLRAFATSHLIFPHCNHAIKHSISFWVGNISLVYIVSLSVRYGHSIAYNSQPPKDPKIERLSDQVINPVNEWSNNRVIQGSNNQVIECLNDRMIKWLDS